MLSTGKSLQAPDRIEDAGFASLVGQSHLSLLVILASLAAALFWGAAHALSPGHGKTIVTAYLVGQRGTPRHAALLGLIVTVTHTIGVFGARPRDARALAVHRPRPPLPVAEPRLGAPRRRHRRLGVAHALAAQPASRPSPPRRGGHELALAVRRRRLRRAAALPVGAGRPARRDLAAPGRLRAAADPRLQRRPRAHDHRDRPRRSARPERLPSVSASRGGSCGCFPRPALWSSSRPVWP